MIPYYVFDAQGFFGSGRQVLQERRAAPLPGTRAPAFHKPCKEILSVRFPFPFPCLLLVIVLLSLRVFAQTLPTPGERDLQRERQEQLLREQQKRLEDLRQLPGESKTAPTPADATTDRCFQIDHIVLEGAEQIDARTRARLVAPYQGKCLDIEQLNLLLKEITAFYFSRGFITTRAYLPQQDLASGQLRIVVIEGRLEGFDDSGVISARELSMTFPGRVGGLLNLREMEQLVDQASRLPSRQIEVEVTPGNDTGNSRMRFKGTREKPWRVSLTRDNNGDRSSGEQQASLMLNWDSPLGLADQIGLRVGQDVVSDRWRRSRNQGLFYSLPYGWWVFRYSYSQSAYRTRHDATGFSFRQDGESRFHQAHMERVLHRNHVSKTMFSLGVSRLDNRNYIDDVLIGVSSSRITESQLGFSHGRRAGNAFVNLDAGWQRGTGALDAQRKDRLPAAAPHGRYDKYTLTASYLQAFRVGEEQFVFDAMATAQKSEDVLYSPQRISLGGVNSIRGFKEQSLSGDSGYYWRNRLRWRRSVGGSPWIREYSLGYAYDFGVIRHGRYNSGQQGRLSGQALEFSLQGQHIAVSLMLARSLKRVKMLEQHERPVYFRIDLFF
jgi:hemolysin activation/secretion protein